MPVRAGKRPITAIAGVVTLTVAAIGPPAAGAGSPAGRTIAAVVGSIPEPMALSRLAAAPVSGIVAVTVTLAAVEPSKSKAAASTLRRPMRRAAAHQPSPPPTQTASGRL